MVVTYNSILLNFRVFLCLFVLLFVCVGGKGSLYCPGGVILFCFFVTGDLTQGLLHARQSLYHFSPAPPALFFLFYFG
jgi:hypothetical protein